jgi:hypothetical protein
MPEKFYEHIIYEYTGISFSQQSELLYDEWLLYRRDAYIARFNRTEEGREYLEKCWISEQTEPDRTSLRRDFNVKETGGDSNG